MKKICICITNFNKEKYLERAIRSCLSQINFEILIEIIVVNDGSKNFNKIKIKKEFPEIKIINLKKNKGVAFASNQAIKYSKADYYIRVDADDYLSMKSCVILSSILKENPKVPYVFGDILKIQTNGDVEKIKRDNRDSLLEHGAGIMFRLKQLKQIKGYNSKIRNCEDFDLLIRLEKKFGKGLHIPISYYRYYKTIGKHLSSNKNRNNYKLILRKKYAKYL